MKQYPWYKRNPRKALMGKQGLSLEQRGVYDTLIDLIYWKNNKLPDNDEFILSWLGRCNMRRWKRIKAELIACGKICVKDGYIYDDMASLEIVSRKFEANIGETSSKDTANLGQELNENNNIPNRQQGHYPESRIQEDINLSSGVAGQPQGISKNGGDGIEGKLTRDTMRKAESLAKGYDIREIIRRYEKWIKGRIPTDLQAHFLSFLETHVKKNPL